MSRYFATIWKNEGDAVCVRQKNVGTSDDNIETIGIKLMQQLNESIPSKSFILHLCGYEGDTPLVYLVNGTSVIRFNQEQDIIKYNFLWSGKVEGIANLLTGLNYGYHTYFTYKSGDIPRVRKRSIKRK
ncbi:hypothetical protein ACHOLT_14400 [Desulfitobacterium sp. Sab5]|uniref:hypothetical protein n=1 Tax=Desulfitobacterium nosdiversum TaxID=3375356 RepID=UPI003CF0AD48